MKEREGRDEVVRGGGEKVEEGVRLGGAGGGIRVKIAEDNELEIGVGGEKVLEVGSEVV